MHYLPPIDDALQQLPLADSTLLRLADAALAEDDARTGEFQQALLDDPAFALWCVGWAWKHEERSLETVGEVVHWLNARGLAAIVNGADEAPTGKIDSLGCVRESLARRKAAAAADASVNDQFMALLSNFARWRGLLSANQEEPDATIGPAWLRELANNVSEPAVADREIDASATNWQVNIPIAWPLFQRAVAMRHKLDEFETRWDEAFLREKLASMK